MSRLHDPEPLVVGHDVGVDGEDGGVVGPDPGEVVLPELLDVTGQVDGLALGHADVDDLK